MTKTRRPAALPYSKACVTWAFFGHIDHAAAVKCQARVGHFGGDGGQFLWLGVQRQVHRLQADILEPCPLGLDQGLVEAEGTEGVGGETQVERLAGRFRCGGRSIPRPMMPSRQHRPKRPRRRIAGIGGEVGEEFLVMMCVPIPVISIPTDRTDSVSRKSQSTPVDGRCPELRGCPESWETIGRLVEYHETHQFRAFNGGLRRPSSCAWCPSTAPYGFPDSLLEPARQ